MLASIHPLGERVRHNRWSVTVTAYVTGSVAAGGALGSLLGAAGGTLGRLSRSGAKPAVAVAVLTCVVAAVLDLGWRQSVLPSLSRQVNEDWLNRYRGWVYGLGFGGQLGLGFVTIVTTAAVYETFILAALVGWASGAVGRGIVAGTAVGAVFGLARALPVALLSRTRQPRQLMDVHRRLALAASRARLIAGVALVLTGGLLGLWVLR